jgi:hypothetical protein
MPTLDDHPSQETTKLLIVGDQGSGKSGLLASLAKDYRLFIADFDNGLDILRDPKVLPKEFRKNIYSKVFYDKNALFNGKMVPAATGFAAFTNDMNDWKEAGPDGKPISMGGIYTWGPKDIFVIDSLTFLGNAIMNYVLQLAGHAGQRPTQPEWGSAIDSQEAVIETLYNPAVKCNVIVTAHIHMQGDEMQGGIQKGVPSALGKKLPPKLGRYFNNVVQIEKSGHGAAVKRQLITTSSHSMNLKVSKPGSVPAIMEPDLSKLFQLLQQ